MNRQDLANQRTFMRAVAQRRAAYMLARDAATPYEPDGQPALFGTCKFDHHAPPIPVVDTSTVNRRDEDAK